MAFEFEERKILIETAFSPLFDARAIRSRKGGNPRYDFTSAPSSRLVGSVGHSVSCVCVSRVRLDRYVFDRPFTNQVQR